MVLPIDRMEPMVKRTESSGLIVHIYANKLTRIRYNIVNKFFQEFIYFPLNIFIQEE